VERRAKKHALQDEKRHRIQPVIMEIARQLRRPQTPAERKLWASLRDRRLVGWKFRRQYPIDRFIADFYCAECKLIVEVDGESHECRADYDAERTEWLSIQGYHVMRVTNQDVYENLEAVLEAIRSECERRITLTP
jgi:very-short-patch-repair endonuclease